MFRLIRQWYFETFVLPRLLCELKRTLLLTYTKLVIEDDRYSRDREPQNDDSYLGERLH